MQKLKANYCKNYTKFILFTKSYNMTCKIKLYRFNMLNLHINIKKKLIFNSATLWIMPLLPTV